MRAKKVLLSVIILCTGVLSINSLFSSCNSKKGVDVSYQIQWNEKDILLALSDNNNSLQFLTILDSAARLQEQFPDSAFIDLFYNKWKTEMSSSYPLAQIFSTYELKDRINFESSDEDVYRVLKQESKQVLGTVFQIIRLRLEDLKCKIEWFGRYENKEQQSKQAIPSPNKLFLTLSDVKNLKTVEDVLTSQGYFDIWETYDNNDIDFTILKEDPKIKQICIFNENTVGATFAFVRDEKAAADVFNQILMENKLPADLLFMYGSPNDGLIPVFTIKSSRSGQGALTGSVITKAKAEKSNYNDMYEIQISLNAEGAKTFSRITENNIGRQLPISIDNRILTAPVVGAQIVGGQLNISGNFTKDEAEYLAIKLNSGTLPVKCNVEILKY